ncbi:hypothetical protein B4U79_07971 [Dinothrombium tinctorium]|uniref:Eclosion hormone-like protein n=1 Tax=Dinothrombium tinctorium TaxID=1965070 RepID=A0A3S3P5N7_9ACAR|nr:hypothetical protein B4U79_02148 [Dinothrombium tinctorium]RWS06585.1 hypothetical protein B4U79_09568 [Dinothrombium tinctorium]RWS08539.1 hypothetical protein B4U79_07971 [Dinothrombium tinctorium]
MISIMRIIAIFTMSTVLIESLNTVENSNSLNMCLHNCALCVRFWQSGLYNGEKCANRCMRFKQNPRVIDPDCKSIHFFNFKNFTKI